MSKERTKAIAIIIFQQLGGYYKVNAMIGIESLVYCENGIQFKVKCKGSKANFIRIIVNALDLYDVEFGNIKGEAYKQNNVFKNIHCEDLKDLIESETGLYLSL